MWVGLTRIGDGTGSAVDAGLCLRWSHISAQRLVDDVAELVLTGHAARLDA